MLFFGVCFFLYFIKLSAGNGFFKAIGRHIFGFSTSKSHRSKSLLQIFARLLQIFARLLQIFALCYRFLHCSG